MSDSLFQVTGISSGISWDEIISKTLEAARKPAEQWQKKIDTLEYKKSLYEEFSSSLFKLRNTLTTLRLPSMFKSKTAEFNVRNAGQPIGAAGSTPKASSAADIIKATVSADAEFAQWKIDVKKIAEKQQVYSDQFDPTATLVTTATSFKIRIGAQVAEITVDPADTIRNINQKIALAKDQNGDKLLVTSQLIDNRLVFESASSGIDSSGIKAQESFNACVESDGTNDVTYLPKPISGTTPPTTYPTVITELKVGGVLYDESAIPPDFTYSAGKITWGTGSALVPSDGALLEIKYDTTVSGYNYSTDKNEFTLDDGGSGILALLGLDDSTHKSAASNAEINVNGITITRSDNVIDDLIAGVKLELVGIGDVTMNITQDTKKATDAVQAFIDAYNEVMTWINDKLDEKYSSATVQDDDFLKNLLDSTDKSTVFGVLHGDQLLWSIKNQLRNLVSNSVSSTSLALATKKYLFTDTDLNLAGNFYVYAAGQALKIDVVKGDSLEDIRDKIATYFSVTSKDGTNPTNDDLKLNAYIRNGQLVVEYNSASTLTSPRTEYIARNHALKDNSGHYYDILPFTATKEPPVSGKFTVQVGEATTDSLGNTVPPKYYYEGTDFEIVNIESSSGVLESRIEWTGNKPADNQSYKVTYEYNPTAVGFSVISGADDLKMLDLHTDTSKSQLSSFGIKTTVTDDDLGKKGLLEFDSDTLFAALAADGNTTAGVMTGFFRSLDTYIGNLVDSSQVIVAGTAVTKGRVATAMNTIDEEVNTLTAQINKLERQLADRQTSMYKQYSDMEMAIQKLNAQMSSLSQYLSNTSSS